MKAGFRIFVGIAAATALVVAGLGAGWLFWGQRLWAPGMGGGSGLLRGDALCDEWNSGWGIMGGGSGYGVMGRGSRWDTPQDCTMTGAISSSDIGAIDLQAAQKAVDAYIQNLGYDNLEISELMEFENSFYAIVREHDTGIGAMELLVDKTTGTVGPEMGPNIMWNDRYGTHRRGGMMGQSSGANSLSAERAVEIAQRWLEENKPDVTVEEHAAPFYGYYTIHTVRDGEIEGMLGVHGTTGQVWYHAWHGAFIRMIESEGTHG